MAYFPDLSVFDLPVYNEKFLKALAVGWLDKQHDFPKGDVPEEFMDKLWQLCRFPIVLFRGFHVCEFCSHSKYIGPLKVRRGDETIELGFGDIGVLGDNNIIFYSPNLIYHYIAVHHFKPPEVFITAVQMMPYPKSDEFKIIMLEKGWELSDVSVSS